MVTTACTSGPSSISLSDTNRKSATGVTGRQLYQQQGWEVWLTNDTQGEVCVAFKPALNSEPPDIAGGYGVSSTGGGFYMYIPRRLEVAYFGFYGRDPFGRSQAELDGQIHRYPDDLNLVQQWNGRVVDFQVESQAIASEGGFFGGSTIGFAVDKITPRPALDPDVEGNLTQGQVDMSGFSSAYEALMRCHHG